MKLTIDSPEAMMELWRELAEKGHTHILLYGDLWAGKTHFAKWFALWLDIDPHLVTSPTYTYCNIYASAMLHCDFYRLEESHELHAKWLIESIEDHDQVLIERPKWESLYADENWLKVHIIKHSEFERTITIEQFIP